MGWSTISVEEYIWAGFGWISIVISLIIVYIILHSRVCRTHTIFHGPFFTLFLVQTLHEVLMFLTINFVNRPRKYKIIYYPLGPAPLLYIGHVFVAFNRITCFITTNLKIYDKIWTGHSVFLLTVLGYLLSVLMHIFQFLSNNEFLLFDNGGEIINLAYTDPNFLRIDSIIEIVYTTLCAVLCISLYTIAGVRCSKSLLAATRKRQEILIMRCAVFISILYVPSLIRALLVFYSMTTGDTSLGLFASRAAAIVTEVLCVFPPWAILISCSDLRHRFFGLFGIRARNPERKFADIPSTTI